MVRIERIQPDHPLYAQECALREQVLLRPVGCDMDRFRVEYPGMEEGFIHFVAVVDHPTGPRVVGTALLFPNYPEPGTGKVMQVAVDLQRQGEGIGRNLIIAIESHGFGRLGLREIFCHSQLSAVEFYERLGWVADEGIFMEMGIGHRRLAIRDADAGHTQ